MMIDPGAAKILAVGGTLSGLGLSFLWRLRPRAPVANAAGAEEARWKLIQGFTWWAGGATGAFATWVLQPFGDWTVTVALAILLPSLARGGWQLWRGVLEGFAATNPRRPEITTAGHRQQMRQAARERSTPTE